MKSNPIVVAVLTTFHPSQSLLHKIAELLKQCAHVVIVDDTGSVGLPFYSNNVSFFNKNKNVFYIANDKNLGIAFSLNKGVQRALELNCDFIVTFDDDTEFCSNYVKECLAFFSANSNKPIGAVCMSRGSQFSSGRSEYKEKRSLITSGFFCRSSIYQSTSFFPEEYFIDLVDFYLSFKIRNRGLKLVELADVGMIHRVGNMKTILSPVKINVFNHSPFRLYYQVRNAIPFFKAFWRTDFVFCAYVLLDVMRIPLKALLFEDRKIERVKYCVKGFVDGVLGRMGRLND